MIARVSAIGVFGFLQLVRSRIYVNLIVGGVALVLCALAFERLSAGEGGRVLIDVGLAFSALLVVVLAGTVAVTVVTREIETKQAHLVVSRPMGRWEFVVGRFTTTALLIVVSQLLLGGLLAGLAAGVGAEGAWRIVVAALFCSFEAFIVAAIAIFFGVGSSSTMSAVFTSTLFILGRMTFVLRDLLDAGKLDGPAKPLLVAVYALLPHLASFDLTTWARTGEGLSAATAGQTALYGIAYTAAFLAFASFRIERRELL